MPHTPGTESANYTVLRTISIWCGIGY